MSYWDGYNNFDKEFLFKKKKSEESICIEDLLISMVSSIRICLLSFPLWEKEASLALRTFCYSEAALNANISELFSYFQTYSQRLAREFRNRSGQISS